MSSTSHTVLGNISGIFIILVVNIHLCACTAQHSMWVKANGTSHMVCPTEALSVTHVSWAIKCGDRCGKEPGCTSFTYYDDSTATNCYIMSGVPTSSMDCFTASNSKHFMKLYTAFTCPASDGDYYTYKHSDGSFLSYRIVTVAADAATARAECSQSGGSLIKLSTVMKLSFIQDVFSACPEFGEMFYYIDGSNDYTDAVWRWKDGETINMNSTFWSDGRPDNPTIEHCVAVDSRYNWRLNDYTCKNVAPYICEKV